MEDITHSVFITQNYKFLERWCRNWAGSLGPDLLSHYTEWLDSNWQKFSMIPTNLEKIKYSQKWLKNQSKWSNSNFNRTLRLNDLSEERTIPDTPVDNLLELRSESDDEEISAWLEEVYKEFGEIGTMKIIKLREIYLKLDVHERVLWDLYYTNMNSMRSISKKLCIPLTAVYKMITDLNNKIKERYD